MPATLVCTMLNAILDPLFIRRMGFRGAAIATLLSQTICLAFMVIYMYRKKVIRLYIQEFRKGLIGEIIAKAVPSVIQQSIPAISTAFLTSLVSRMGLCAIWPTDNGKTGDYPVLSGDGNQYGADEYHRTMRRSKKKRPGKGVSHICPEDGGILLLLLSVGVVGICASAVGTIFKKRRCRGNRCGIFPDCRRRLCAEYGNELFPRGVKWTGKTF